MDGIILEEMFATGSNLKDVDPLQIIKQDRKIYSEGDWKFGISQMEIVGFKLFHEKKDSLTEMLTKVMGQEGSNFSCLMATDITSKTSLLICTGETKILDAITYPRIEENVFEMKDVLSRKKQVLPYLLDVIRKI